MPSINDFSQFVALRSEARVNENAALRDVAEQFETLFLQNMLKSMRDASFGDPMFGNSAGSSMFRDMFDQQIAGDIASGQGIGLADLLVRQLGGDAVTRPSSSPTTSAIQSVRRVVKDAGSRVSTGWEDAKSFIEDILPHAKQAAAALGVSPLAVLSQTALETGWGKRVMASDDGESSHNLFGIKATTRWQGDVVQRSTMEFEDGVAKRQLEPFRAYGSIAASFADYVGLLRGSSRYAEVTNQQDDIGGFASALQSGGYATDPAYAEKISAIAGGSTMKKVLQSLKETDLLSLSTHISGASGAHDEDTQ